MKPNIRAIRDRRLKEANEKAEEARAKAHEKAHEKSKGKGHEKHHDDPPTPVSADLVRPSDGVGVVDSIPEPVIPVMGWEEVEEEEVEEKKPKKPKKTKKAKKTKKNKNKSLWRDYDDKPS